RIEMISGDYKLLEGVYLIPHKTPGLSEIGKREKMYQRTKHGWMFDDFSHEQSLVLDTDKGLVILNSCSHGGAANIINEVKETFPDKRVYGYIGGMHLFNKTEEEIRATAAKIRETGIEYVCTGHCTGDRAFGILKEELGDTVCQMQVGYNITF
ncbi:MAG: MBL fold metallo-hydrolase, partial [Lachnospiraceae bacterium]|nr:MBL fold metallo-hydrolase [Lachnospiraceae bacterium]